MPINTTELISTRPQTLDEARARQISAREKVRAILDSQDGEHEANAAPGGIHWRALERPTLRLPDGP